MALTKASTWSPTTAAARVTRRAALALSLALAATGLLSAGAAAQAQSAASDRVIPSVSETTCRELLLAPGDEEDNIMIFFHGYVSGSRGQDAVDVDAFSLASEAVAEACVDDPSALLLDVFLDKR